MSIATTAHNKVALVFGGSRGIGAAITRRLAREGYAVGLTYVTRADKAAEVVADIEAGGGRALAIEADSADPDALRRAVDTTVARFGLLRVAVINAGIYRHNLIESVSLDELNSMLNVNVRGVFLALQSAVAQMRDGGRVITIGSNTAIRTGTPGSSVYAMTKAALPALVRGAALDLAPRRISVNNVQPGPTQTDITSTQIDSLIERVPLGRIAQPEEIAELVAYLVGDPAGYMTGSSLTIDGGFVL